MIKARRAMSNSNPRLQKLIQTALGKREHLLTDETDLVRLIDGDGDGLPGITLENFGPAWLISTQEGRLDWQIMDELSPLAPSLYWKRLDQHLKEAPEHLSGPELPEFFTGKENGLISRLSFQSGYSQGIFIDQRDNRAHLREIVKPGQTVLNTFSYTGFFSVAAAATGATTTTLDLSQVYLDWAKENFRLNQLDVERHYFCKGDTFHWLRRFARQGRRFNYIILDPPTFSRDDNGKVFRVEKDYGRLFKMAIDCLEPGGTILACTNFRGMRTHEFEAQLEKSSPKPLRMISAEMPNDFPESPYLKSIWATT